MAELDWDSEAEGEVMDECVAKEPKYSYKILDVISRGSVMQYRCRNKNTNKIVVVREEVDGRLNPTSKAEVETLKALGPHPCIVGLERVVRTVEGSMTVIVDYMKSDLEKWRKERCKPYSLNQINYVMKQILKGVAFLHDHGVTHGDLKPANILVDDNGWETKICYIGRTLGVGTSWYYKAPELLLGSCAYTCGADIWSVGCIMAEMLVDHVFFPGYSEADQLDCIQRTVRPPYNFLRQKIAAAKYSEAAVALTPAGLDLLQRLLAYDINERITVRDALDHAWFRE